MSLLFFGRDPLNFLKRKFYNPLRSVQICLGLVPDLCRDLRRVSAILRVFIKARRGKNLAISYPKVFLELAAMVRVPSSCEKLSRLHGRLLPDNPSSDGLERSFYFRSLVSEQMRTLYRHVRTSEDRHPVELRYVGGLAAGSTGAEVYFSTHLFGVSLLSQMLMRRFKSVVGINFQQSSRIGNLNLLGTENADERMFLMAHFVRALRAGATGTLYLDGGRFKRFKQVDFLGQKIDVGCGLMAIFMALPVRLIPSLPVLVEGEPGVIEIHLGAPLTAADFDLGDEERCMQQIMDAYTNLLLETVRKQPSVAYQFDLSYIDLLS